MKQRYAFVVRIWLTESYMPSGHAPSGMRGTLQSINSSQPSYFTSLRQLNNLLEEALQRGETPESNSTSTDQP